MLEELGCETLTSRSGTDALGRLANDRNVDLLVADINMPGLSGIALAQRAEFPTWNPGPPAIRS
jgi:CheY-like chemotaxis protein